MSDFIVRDLACAGLGPVSFALEAGERLGLTGPSGCGKTRLLRALADLDPWRGEILLDRQAPSSMAASAWRRSVAYVPAESQWWYDTVGAHFKAAPAEGDLRALGLEDHVLQWPVARLSSGEKQRLALLRTLVGEPAVLLLDEPTAHLDDERERAFEALVSRRCEAEGLMVVWVAHDAAQLRRLASRCCRMGPGGVWEEAAAWA